MKAPYALYTNIIQYVVIILSILSGFAFYPGYIALDKNTIDIRNFNDKTNSPAKKEVQSVLGTVQLNYRNKLFLDVSNRNDWSSTLAYTPSEKGGYNYFSAGAAIVLNEFMRLPRIFEYLRLRASYAVVGNDIAAFSTHPLLLLFYD